MKKIVYLFILLNSEKNEPRSAAAVIGPFGLSLRSPSGGCGTRSAQTVLALFPPSSLRLRRPIKAESGIVTVAVFFNPSVLRTPPLYFAAQNTLQCYGVRLGERVIPDLLLLLPMFSNPSVTACHLPYILRCKTQGRSFKISPIK